MNQHVQTQVNKQENTYYNVLHITKKQLGVISKLLVTYERAANQVLTLRVDRFS